MIQKIAPQNRRRQPRRRPAQLPTRQVRKAVNQVAQNHRQLSLQAQRLLQVQLEPIRHMPIMP